MALSCTSPQKVVRVRIYRSIEMILDVSFFPAICLRVSLRCMSLSRVTITVWTIHLVPHPKKSDSNFLFCSPLLLSLSLHFYSRRIGLLRISFLVLLSVEYTRSYCRRSFALSLVISSAFAIALGSCAIYVALCHMTLSLLGDSLLCVWLLRSLSTSIFIWTY